MLKALHTTSRVFSMKLLLLVALLAGLINKIYGKIRKNTEQVYLSPIYILFEHDNKKAPIQYTCIPKLRTTYRSTCYGKLMPGLWKRKLSPRSFKVSARKVTAIWLSLEHALYLLTVQLVSSYLNCSGPFYLHGKIFLRILLHFWP